MTKVGGAIPFIVRVLVEKHNSLGAVAPEEGPEKGGWGGRRGWLIIEGGGTVGKLIGEGGLISNHEVWTKVCSFP